MDQHTPKPWRYDRVAHEIHAQSSWMGQAEIYVVADLNCAASGEISPDESDANGRLMAAAPELLAALKESLRWIAKVAADHDDDPILSGQAIRAHDRAVAVIRGATEEG